MTKRIWILIGVIWVLALLIATNTTAVSRDDAEYQTDTATQFVEPRVDLYGNEISDAVGDYRVDGQGTIYEGHAPDTAVLKLGPAGT